MEDFYNATCCSNQNSKIWVGDSLITHNSSLWGLSFDGTKLLTLKYHVKTDYVTKGTIRAHENI